MGNFSAKAKSRSNNHDGATGSNSTKKAHLGQGLGDEMNDAEMANILETDRFMHIRVHKN